MKINRVNEARLEEAFVHLASKRLCLFPLNVTVDSLRQGIPNPPLLGFFPGIILSIFFGFG